MSDRPGPDPTVSDEQILSLFRESTDPVLTASEIADQVDLTRRNVLNRLKDLESNGHLRSKKVGGRSTVWWLPGETSTSGQ
ncbi:HTH domain-containing protein [Halorubrum terrestre]|uniref:HTH domain-containing protein n=1 Tax=Halorubrum distributum TaxID=29283 RepID=A0A6B1IAG2_9EURY|nr:winged helix-turn-helix domain-containing protein [Halorubrum terrestre]MYL16167.1 HTH domain-containing protein [Halorubrum terrestre]